MPVPAPVSVALRWTPTPAEALVRDREIPQFQRLAEVIGVHSDRIGLVWRVTHRGSPGAGGRGSKDAQLGSFEIA
jgi:hypothetical protein